MINSCLHSTFRIYNTILDVNSIEVSQFIKKNLEEDTKNRINISQLIKFCSHNDEIRYFFTLIGKEPPEKKKYTINEYVYLKEDPKSQIPEQLRKEKSEPINQLPLGIIINKKSHLQKLDFVNHFSKKLNL